MPEVILNGSRVVTVTGELVSGTMPQHVGVDLKGKLCLLTGALHQPIEPIWCEWRPSLVDKHECGLGGLALELAQGAHFVSADGMGGWLAILGAADMQGCAGKVDLRPL